VLRLPHARSCGSVRGWRQSQLDAGDVLEASRVWQCGALEHCVGVLQYIRRSGAEVDTPHVWAAGVIPSRLRRQVDVLKAMGKSWIASRDAC